MAKVKFGIIGCGAIAANSFAPSLLASEEAELVAVCRRDREKAQTWLKRAAEQGMVLAEQELLLLEGF